MITSLNVLYSQQSDLHEIKQRYHNHPSERTLIQVFSGQVGKTQIERLLSELTEIFPNTPIIGTTTAGEILGHKVAENSVVINISFFDSTTISTTLVDYEHELWLMGKSLARDLVGGNAPSNGNCSIPLRLSATRGLQACSTPSVSRNNILRISRVI